MTDYIETTRRATHCPYCHTAKIGKWGIQAGNQRYRCNGCKRTFLDTGALSGHRMPAEHVGHAIRLFYSGMSYKQIAEAMAAAYDIPEPSKATIYEWVRNYTDKATKEMGEHKADVGDSWVADEMMLDVGGEKMWNWNVMDEKTRYILASHLSRDRSAGSARKVMDKALAAAKTPPKTIKTDKLRSYTAALKDYPDIQHVQSEGIRAELNNNLSERLQGTFRSRTKTLRGLDSLESGQRYLDGWVLTYNLFREHEAIGSQPPARKAKMIAPYTEWADVVREPVKVVIPAPKVADAPKATVKPKPLPIRPKVRATRMPAIGQAPRRKSEHPWLGRHEIRAMRGRKRRT